MDRLIPRINVQTSCCIAPIFLLFGIDWYILLRYELNVQVQYGIYLSVLTSQLQPKETDESYENFVPPKVMATSAEISSRKVLDQKRW